METKADRRKMTLILQISSELQDMLADEPEVLQEAREGLNRLRTVREALDYRKQVLGY